MVTAALRCLASPQLSQNGDKRRIKYRDKEYQDRYRKYRQQAAGLAAGLIQHDRRPEQKADEHRTAIAHEDRRGIEIEDQKSEQGAYKYRDQKQVVSLSVAGKVEPQRYGPDGRDPRRQAVHVIEQIDGVSDADQPKNGDPDIDDLIAGDRQL